MGSSEKPALSAEWGRTADATSPLAVVTTLLVLFGTPPLVAVIVVAYAHFNSSMSDALLAFASTFSDGSTRAWLRDFFPTPTPQAFLLVLGWMAVLAVLTLLVPGKTGYGLKTPAGHTLPYRVNGLAVFGLVHITLAALVFSGRFSLAAAVVDPIVFPQNFAAASIVGYALSFFVYFKAYLFPSHPDDRKFSGSPLYDFMMGIELNPRMIAGRLDFKLFFIGKFGMVSWSVVNLAFAERQVRLALEAGGPGTSLIPSNALMVSLILQTFYVVDFFVKEDWYLRTIDIGHDHFGWYLAWGDIAWLPVIYTAAVGSLSHHDKITSPDISPLAAAAILMIGLVAYYLFRVINDQKEFVRKNKGDCIVWGKPAEFITAKYVTKDGSNGTSILITSGFWGISRHFNYAVDMLLSFCYCAPAGLQKGVIPYTYFIFMVILLVHRSIRDHERCKAKYGPAWDEYCRRVPYKILPFVF